MRQNHTDTACPAADYDHKADLVYCYAHVIWGGKSGGNRSKAKECNTLMDYCRREERKDVVKAKKENNNPKA